VFSKTIPGVILNTFNVEYKIETTSSTGQSGDKTSRISEKTDIISENNIEEYNLSFQSLELLDTKHANAIISRIRIFLVHLSQRLQVYRELN